MADQGDALVGDGKIQSVTWYNQAMYFLVQLGLAPVPEAAAAP
jgi:hypothetical protein